MVLQVPRPKSVLTEIRKIVSVVRTKEQTEVETQDKSDVQPKEESVRRVQDQVPFVRFLSTTNRDEDSLRSRLRGTG